jgi:hypothetical protein
MLVLMAWMSTMGLRTIPRTWTVVAYVIVKDKNGHIIRPNAVNRDAFSIAYSPTYIRAVPRRDYVKITATATEVEQNIPAMTITYGREGNVIFDLDDPSIQAVRHNWKNKYVITTPLAMQPIVDQDAFGNVTAGP